MFFDCLFLDIIFRCPKTITPKNLIPYNVKQGCILSIFRHNSKGNVIVQFLLYVDYFCIYLNAMHDMHA